MEAVLEYIKQSYDNPPVYILENGQSLLWLIYSSLPHVFDLDLKCHIQTGTPMTQHKDTHRVEYMNAYIGGVLKSIR